MLPLQLTEKMPARKHHIKFMQRHHARAKQMNSFQRSNDQGSTRDKNALSARPPASDALGSTIVQTWSIVAGMKQALWLVHGAIESVATSTHPHSVCTSVVASQVRSSQTNFHQPRERMDPLSRFGGSDDGGRPSVAFVLPLHEIVLLSYRKKIDTAVVS